MYSVANDEYTVLRITRGISEVRGGLCKYKIVVETVGERRAQVATMREGAKNGQKGGV